MKRLISIPFVLIIVLSLQSNAGAQDSLKSRKLSVNLSQMILMETRLTWAWQQNENNIYSVSIGYKPKTKSNIYNSRSWLFEPIIETPEYYAGAAANVYYGGIGWQPKLWDKFILKGELFYKYIRTGEYLYGYMTSSYGFKYYLDDFQAHVAGVKVLFETNLLTIFSGTNCDGKLSVFAGFGARVNQTNRTTLAEAYSSYEGPADIITMKRKTDPLVQKEFHVLPSIQMGAKFNLTWNER